MAIVGLTFQVFSLLSWDRLCRNPLCGLLLVSGLSGLVPSAHADALRASERQLANGSAERSHTVAEINRVKITKDQLRQAAKKYLGAEANHFEDERSHPVLKGVLTRMVERELMLQAARQQKLTVSDTEVDRVLARTEQELPPNVTLDQKLSSEGTDRKTLREEIAADLLVEHYLNSVVYGSVEVAEETAKSYYQEHREHFRKPIECRLRHIVLRVPDSATPEQIALIREALVALRTQALVPGVDFSNLAKEVSEGHTRARGGDMGYLTKNQLPPELADPAFALNLGEISEPLLAAGGWYLFKLEDRRGGEFAAFEEVRAQIHAQVLQVEQEEKLAEHLQRLKSTNSVIVYLR